MEIVHKTDMEYPYFMAIEDGEEIGYVRYFLDKNDVMVITFVGVNPKHRGKGKARELMMGVVDFARNHNHQIRPVCSYAVAFFERSREVQGLLE